MKKNQETSGITLIALVVTIIVLLILAVITFKLLGDDGIIGKAKWSAYVTEYESVDEAKNLYVNSHIIEKFGTKKVQQKYKVASLDNYAKTLEEKLQIYPVDTEINMNNVSTTLRESVSTLENIESDELSNIDLVHLYKVDFNKIDVKHQKEYAINVVSGMLYSIESETYNENVYHTPRIGVSTELIEESIKNPGSYELVLDAGTVAKWISIEMFYDKFVANSVTCEFEISNDQSEWTSVTTTTENQELKEEYIIDVNAPIARYLRMKINISEVNGDNSEIAYLLANYKKFKRTSIKPTINTTKTDKIGNIYIANAANATVVQSFTVPTDASYIATIPTIYGEPNINIQVTGISETLTPESLKEKILPPGSTVTISATLAEGEGISEAQLLMLSQSTSTQRRNDITEQKESEEWRTVKTKQYLYNNHGIGRWMKTYFNSTVVETDGIIPGNANYKRVKVTYQTSSDAENFGGAFSDVTQAGGTQYLQVNVEYQVLGNNQYGTINKDSVLVLRDIDVDDSNESNTPYTVSWNGANGTVNVTTETVYSIQMSDDGVNWSDVNTMTKPSGSTIYVRLFNGVKAGDCYSIDLRRPGTVTYMMNNGSNSVFTTQKSNYGDTVNVYFDSTPERSQYDFLGWSTDSTDTTPTYTANGNKTFSMGNEDITLYAVWELRYFTITFHKNDGTTVTSTQSVEKGETAMLKFNTFERSGYWFSEWNTNANGTGQTYENQANITANTNIDLYAQWRLVNNYPLITGDGIIPGTSLASNALEYNAYDGNDSTYMRKGGTYYIDVDKGMMKKYLYLNMKNHGYSSIKIACLNSAGTELSSTVHSGRADAVFQNFFYISDNTTRIAVTFNVWNHEGGNYYTFLYEMKVRNEPVISQSAITYPLLTSSGTTAGKRTVSIEYFSSSVQRKYKIGNGSWRDYQGPVEVTLGDVVYAKGIDKNGVQTRIVSEFTVTFGDALGKQAYDNDINTHADYFTSSNPNTLYMAVDSTMQGRSFNVNYRPSYGSSVWNKCVITFLDSSNSSIGNTVELPSSGTTKNVSIPQNCTKMRLYICSGGNGSETEIAFQFKEITPN